MSRFVQVLLVVLSIAIAGVANGDQRMSYTYPNYLSYGRDDVSPADVYPDTTVISPEEMSFVSPNYDDVADLIAVAEVVGARYVSRYDHHPISLCMAGGEWQFDAVFVKQPRLTELGYRMLSYVLAHGPGGSERNQPWVTIHALDSLPSRPSEKRVIVFATVDKPFPEFWGGFEVLPDNLQRKIAPWH